MLRVYTVGHFSAKWLLNSSLDVTNPNFLKRFYLVHVSNPFALSFDKSLF